MGGLKNKMKKEFVTKIEEMKEEKIKEIIQQSMNFQPYQIRVIPFIGKEKITCKYTYAELIARCPMTGLKDVYKIIISFIPDKFIPELKSLRYFFDCFEDLPISHEHLLCKIFSYFKETVKPLNCNMELIVAIRGGIKTEVVIQ